LKYIHEVILPYPITIAPLSKTIPTVSLEKAVSYVKNGGYLRQVKTTTTYMVVYYINKFEFAKLEITNKRIEDFNKILNEKSPKFDIDSLNDNEEDKEENVDESSDEENQNRNNNNNDVDEDYENPFEDCLELTLQELVEKFCSLHKVTLCNNKYTCDCKSNYFLNF
jgi:hypothetical protein